MLTLVVATATLTASPAAYGQFDFTLAGPFDVGDTPIGLTAGDLDNDGILDLAVVNAIGDTMTLLFGDGTGGFAPGIDYGGLDGPIAITSSDFDADGVLDLAIASVVSGELSVFFGTGGGVFGPPVLIPIDDPRNVVAGDFDGDGFLDLAASRDPGGLGPGFVDIFVSDGAGGFGTPTETTAALNTSSLVPGDWTGDGILDLVVGNSGAVPGLAGAVQLMIGDGTGNFATEELALGNFNSVTVGDFNDDGVFDFAAGTLTDIGCFHFIEVYLFDNGSYVLSQGISIECGPNELASADLDQDGALDLVVADQGADIVAALPGSANGEFGPDQELATGSFVKSPITADFNNDGQADIAVIFVGSDQVAVLLNGTNPGGPLFKRGDVDGNGELQLPDPLQLLNFLFVPGSPVPSCMDAGDVDDSGDLGLPDGVLLLFYLFVPGSTPPAAPFPDCGVDPTVDGLADCSYPMASC